MTTPLAHWANARLSAWLQDDNPALDLLGSIKEAAEHWTACDGTDRTCAGVTDKCKGGQDCKHCATPCEDCLAYRAGHGTGLWATRPTLDLVNDLELLLESREMERAS